MGKASGSKQKITLSTLQQGLPAADSERLMI